MVFGNRTSAHGRHHPRACASGRPSPSCDRQSPPGGRNTGSHRTCPDIELVEVAALEVVPVVQHLAPACPSEEITV